MPEISRLYGINIKMFYNVHNPPHFHIEYQDYEAIVEIKTGEVKGNMSRRALKLVYEWLDEHQDELLENWELSQNRIPLKNIEPLK